MLSSSRGRQAATSLPQLQNLIKRDPKAYREEFLQQWTHYESIRKVFEMNPTEHMQRFRETVSFIAQVSYQYPGEASQFAEHITSLLLQTYGSLSQDIRQVLVSNLVMLRKRGVITSFQLLKALIPLLAYTTSSTLRSFIRKTIVSDIYAANINAKNHKLNRALHAILFQMLEKDISSETRSVVYSKHNNDRSNVGRDAMWAVILAMELWKKGVWNDERTISIISMGCFHPSLKVQSASLHFFLGKDLDAEEEEEDYTVEDVRSAARDRGFKKSSHTERKLTRSMKSAKKKRKSRGGENASKASALHLLRDPQTFAEKLFDSLVKSDKVYKLEHKLLILQLLTLLIGMNKLCILGLYSYLIQYLTPRQLQVTSILTALAQSVHDLTLPDDLQPIIRKISQEFIHPGVGSEVVTVGLNSVREICSRQPLCMEEDLLSDLIEYRKSRDRGVVAAARGLLQLYREADPSLLKRRERGKPVAVAGKNVTLKPYGHESTATTSIDGLSLLEEHYRKLGEGDDQKDDESQWNDWEIASESDDDSDSSEGWVSVSSDEDRNLELSDSDESEDDEKPGVTIESAPAESALATTKVLTPADFALLEQLRAQASSESSKRSTKRNRNAMEKDSESSRALTEEDLIGPRKKVKSTYEDRIASIQKGREDRPKFGSAKGKKQKATPSSTTNRQKARNKPIMMILSSGSVQGKKKASLRDKAKRLQKHLSQQKRG